MTRRLSIRRLETAPIADSTLLLYSYRVDCDQSCLITCPITFWICKRSQLPNASPGPSSDHVWQKRTVEWPRIECENSCGHQTQWGHERLPSGHSPRQYASKAEYVHHQKYPKKLYPATRCITPTHTHTHNPITGFCLNRHKKMQNKNNTSIEPR